MSKPSVPCPACANTHTKAIKPWRLGKHNAIACWRCGLVFTHPQPAPETLEAYYQPDGGWREFRPDPKGTDAQTRHKGPGGLAVLDVLDRYVPPGTRRVLDFGCGVGAWLNVLQDRGWETYGIEPSSDAAFVRHQRLHEIPSDGSFDLLVMYHVLEHLPRPLETLRQLSAAMRVGGYCFVSVPRLDAVASHRKLTYCLHPTHHIVAFTEACLRGLLAGAGFQVVTALHEMDPLFTDGVPLRLRLLARRVPNPLPWPDPAKSLRALFENLIPLLEERKEAR